MADQHPITPPPELVEQWMREAHDQPPGPDARLIATLAARWGADQELEACCEHLKRIWSPSDTIDSLRAARRPKPPSLKQQALEALSRLNSGSLCANPVTDKETIRRALEQLND